MKKIISCLALTLFLCGSVLACPGTDCKCHLAKVEKCADCGLVKGSEACCKVLCSDCGEIKGTKQCCRADAKRCGSCGKIKGAPGCCLDAKSVIKN